MAGASGDAHIIDITIQTQDRTGAGIQSAERRLSSFDRSITRTQQNLRRMAADQYRVTVGLIDRVTPQSSAINAQLRSLAAGRFAATVRLVDRASSGVRELHANLRSLTSRTWQVITEQKNKMSSKMDGALQATTGFTGTMLAGAGIGMGIADTVNTFKSFEEQMSSVGSILGKTSDQMTNLTAKAKEMGATTSFSASEAGKAMEYMAMAGWDEGQITGGIKGIMDLAAASGESLGTVSDIVTDAMTGFGLKAEQSGHFADVLAKTASSANTNVAMLGETFKYVAPVAGSLKYSVEDVSLAIGLMANSGIKASQAGTSLRSIFTRMVSPPKDAAEAMAALGIEAKNADGSMKPLNTVLKEMRKSFNGLTDSQKAQYASQIAGQEAMSGLLAIMNASDADFKKLETSINNSSGAADKMAKIKMDNLAGDLKVLSSVWESFQLSLMDGSGAGNGLRSFVQAAREDLEKFVGYMKDGLDFGDIAKLAMDVITQLKKKFFEFDGIGSMLAGGALYMGLMKIIKTAKKVGDAIRNARPSATGGAVPTGTGTTGVTGGLPGANNVTVSANTVVINASTVQQGGAPGAPAQTARPAQSPAAGDRPARPSSQAGAPAGWRSSVAQTARTGFNAARNNIRAGGMEAGMTTAAGGIMAGVMAVEDYRQTRDFNQQQIDEADWRYKTANDAVWQRRKDYEDAKTSGASEQELQMIKNDVMALENEKADAEADREKVKEFNTNRENAAAGRGIGSTVGTLLGGVIGTAIGGPAGTMAGSMIGGSVGGMAGELIGANWADITKSASETFDGISQKAADLRTGIGDSINGLTKEMGDAFLQAGENVADKFTYIKEAAARGIDEAGEYWSGVGDSISNAVANIDLETVATSLMGPFNLLIEEGLMAVNWAALAEGASLAIDSAVEVLSAMPETINSTTFVPMQEFAQATWEAIGTTAQSLTEVVSSAFSAAWGAVQGIWAGAASWFESAVIGPIKEKFASIKNAVSSVMPGGGESGHASGGIFTSRHHALIAESGPEAVIPLSSSSRNRGIDLWEKAASALGIESVPVDKMSGESGGALDSTTDMLQGFNFDKLAGGVGGGFGGGIFSGGELFKNSNLLEQVSGIIGGNTGMQEEMQRGDLWRNLTEPLGLKNIFGGNSADNEEPAPTGGEQKNENANAAGVNSIKIDIGGISPTFNISGGNSQEIVAAINQNLGQISDMMAGQLAQQMAAIFANQPVTT